MMVLLLWLGNATLPHTTQVQASNELSSHIKTACITKESSFNTISQLHSYVPQSCIIYEYDLSDRSRGKRTGCRGFIAQSSRATHL